jgi:hypothetical protein
VNADHVCSHTYGLQFVCCIVGVEGGGIFYDGFLVTNYSTELEGMVDE